MVTSDSDQHRRAGSSALICQTLSETVPSTIEDSQCDSSQQTSRFAAQAVMRRTQDGVTTQVVKSKRTRSVHEEIPKNSRPLIPQ